ncbi:hypothetical protein SGRA_4182 [Saprospira grandis str. Lewin]|uniref:Uncharacterized protein n=1 Tax=Saprospira grandis (strain Lewin) TaxID=984262 RepID=H6L8U1_SAPGL|nr:hypothetical protein SGRA_4182 [Saprospira grandis str. Lewin]
MRYFPPLLFCSLLVSFKLKSTAVFCRCKKFIFFRAEEKISRFLLQLLIESR